MLGHGRDGGGEGSGRPVLGPKRVRRRGVPAHPGGRHRRAGAQACAVRAARADTLEVDFELTQMADMAELAPGSVRTAAARSARGRRRREVFRAWRALCRLAGVE